MRSEDSSIGTLRHRKVIAVCCGAYPSKAEAKLAYEVGREIALRGAVLVCGGLGGSMEAACRGAKESGGVTIGVLPTYDKKTANRWVDIIVPTGLGHARNNLVAATGDGVIGVGGGWGTLSEVAIATKMGKPVAVLAGWQAESSVDPSATLHQAKTPEEAVSIALGENSR